MARILVVDDENNIRMMVRLALRQAGHEVTCASDGPEGLDKFGDGSGFDLVLLDQRMPGMEGLQVLRTMRERDPDARIVMVTAFGTIDLAVEAMRAGATDFLRKPFTAEMLRGAALSALDRVAKPAQPTGGVMFGSTTINGYRIEYRGGAGAFTASPFHQTFTVRDPRGESRQCEVILPAYVVELVKAHTDRDEMPGGARFWQGLCEEALANFLWQNAEFPPDDRIRVDDLSPGLRRFIDAVLAS